MSAGAGDINAGGATVYLNLGTNAKDSNVATYIKNEVLQVQTIVKNYAAQTNVSLTSVKSSWFSMRATISGVAGATTSVLQKLVSAIGHVTMYAANLTQIGNTLRGGGMAVLNRFASVLSDFAARGDVFSKMADKTGVGAEALSALGYAAEQSGVSVDALGRSLSKMQDNLASAKREGGDLKLGALTLDESILDLDADQQFKRLAQAIAGIADPAKRTQAAIDAFGRVGAELLPLLAQGERGIAALEARAKELGATFSDVQARDATAWGDMVADLKTALGSLGKEIAAAAIPALMNAARALLGLLPAIRDFVKENSALIVMVGAGAAAAVALGTALSALGTVLGAIVPLALGAVGAIGLLVADLSPLGRAASAVADWVGEEFGQMLADVREVVNGVVALLSGGRWQEAADLAMLGVRLAWAEGVDWLQTRWEKFSQWAGGWWADLAAACKIAASDLWADVEAAAIVGVQGAKKAWAGLSGWAEQIFLKVLSSFNSTIASGFDQLAKAAKWAGLDSAAGAMGLAALATRVAAPGVAAAAASAPERRQAELAKLEAETVSLLAASRARAEAYAAEAATAAGEDKRKSAADAARAASARADEIASLRGALAQALEKAKSAPAEAAAAEGRKRPARERESLTETLPPAARATARTTATGSFSAFARFAAAAPNDAEKEAARNTRAMVREQKRTNDQLAAIAAREGGIPVTD